MNFDGLILAGAAFLLIGMFHPIVIKLEYYFGTKAWPVLAVLGTFAAFASLLVSSTIFSTLLGVLACVLFWSIHELFQQKKRVERGWFPKRR